MVHFNGDNPLLPWPSVGETIAHWRRINGVDASPGVTSFSNGPSDHTVADEIVLRHFHGVQAQIKDLLVDPDGSVVAQFFGITCYNGKAYIGSLKNNFIAILNPKD